MRGIVSGLIGLCGALWFSLLMFSSNGLSFFWLFLELATLCVVPVFFVCSSSQVLVGLFNYVVASSISSSLILCGILSEDLLFLLILGLILKFGLFPLWGWVYSVVLNSNWSVVWSLSTILKSPVLFFPFILSCGGCGLVNWVCCLTLMGVCVLFWLYNFSWLSCWCHMMLSSSAALVAMSFVLGFDILCLIFLVYCAWASVVVFFFYSYDGNKLGGFGYYFWFCFILISMPVSVSIFYKLIIVSGVMSCYFVVLFCWVAYSFSEQFYLLKFIMSFDLPKSSGGFVSVV